MRGLCWVLLAALTMAGCADPSAPAASSLSTAPAVTEVPSTGADTGTIVGQVLDDELRPIPKAQVGLAKLDARVETNETGGFEFRGVPVGSVAIFVSALGYQDSMQRADVVAGETSRVTVSLKPIPIPEPRVVVIPHTTVITGYYAMALVDQTCSGGCVWSTKVDPGATYLVIEIHGKHSVSNVAFGDALTPHINKNGASGTKLLPCNEIDVSAGRCLLPIVGRFNGTALEELAPAGPLTSLRHFYICEFRWFCVEDRFDTWESLFYDMDPAMVPADYTALPKN